MMVGRYSAASNGLSKERLVPGTSSRHSGTGETGGADLEAFAAPDFYTKPRAEIFDLETQLKTARDKVAHLYTRWHELELLQSVLFS
jgi:hypothetical protein